MIFLLSIDNLLHMLYNHIGSDFTMPEMKALICSSDLKMKIRLCNKLKTYYDFKLLFDNDTGDFTEFFEADSADIVFVSVCSGENYYQFLQQIHQSGAVVYLIGDDEKQSVLVYQYKCDGFIHIREFDDDIDFCMSKFALLSKRRKHIYAVTFGRFDIFVDDIVVNFRSVKSKELLAICIDRQGGEVTMDEAVDKLWPERCYDEKVKRLYRKAVMMLNKIFDDMGIPDAFVTRRGSCCIRKDRFECDYFRFCEDTYKYFDLFNDEYMFDYTWAESTLVNLLEIKNKYLMEKL